VRWTRQSGRRFGRYGSQSHDNVVGNDCETLFSFLLPNETPRAMRREAQGRVVDFPFQFFLRPNSRPAYSATDAARLNTVENHLIKLSPRYLM
jgi:hypothetical protein